MLHLAANLIKTFKYPTNFFDLSDLAFIASESAFKADDLAKLELLVK